MPPSASRDPSGRRPNLVLIVGEDTGRYLSCYGDPVACRFATTPNLQRLADRGCVYDQAWSTAPVCAPSRSSMMTGRHPVHYGAHHMRSHASAPPRVFTQQLVAAGYHVSWPTKLDFNFDPADCPGVTDTPWRTDDRPWRDRLASGEVGRDQPFFGYVNLDITHESGLWPREPHPLGPPDRPRGAPWHDDVPDPAVRHDPDAMKPPPYLPDCAAVRADLARYYDRLSSLDRMVGDILDAVEASGRSDQTHVMFIADHGRGLIREKRWLYPAGVHMPLILTGPGVEPGSRSDRLVSWVDLAPTLLALADAAPLGSIEPPAPDLPSPEHIAGVPFRTAGGAPSPGPGRDQVCFARDRMDAAFDRVRGATDGRRLLLRNDFPEIPQAQRIRYMEHSPTTQALRRLSEAGPVPGDAPDPSLAFLRHPRPRFECYDLADDPFAVMPLPIAPGDAGFEPFAGLHAAIDRCFDPASDLGVVAESELVAAGISEPRIPAEQLEGTLPPAQRIAGVDTIYEMPASTGAEP